LRLRLDGLPGEIKGGPKRLTIRSTAQPTDKAADYEVSGFAIVAKNSRCLKISENPQILMKQA
jgi:hypothetical protein